MRIGDILEVIVLILFASALLVIGIGALRNVPRHRKGKFRYTRRGKASEFE